MATQATTQSLTQATPTSAQPEPKLSGMSFVELDQAINHELVRCNERLIPYLREMRGRFEQTQGTRNDLHPDTPATGWQAWVKSKQDMLGSLSTVKRLLAAARDPTLELTPVQDAVVKALTHP
jgi:hypothetical protein